MGNGLLHQHTLNALFHGILLCLEKENGITFEFLIHTCSCCNAVSKITLSHIPYMYTNTGNQLLWSNQVMQEIRNHVYTHWSKPIAVICIYIEQDKILNA